MIRKTGLSIIIGIALCVAASGISQAKTFPHLVVFGDSLSDNGIDDGNGFMRKSNGKVWPEYLAEMMGAKTVDVRAWSGAMSGLGNYSPNAKDWSGLLWQVQKYTPSTVMDETLVVVEIGTNDLHDPDTKVTPAQVVENVMKALEGLSSKGVKHLMLWNLNASLVSPGYTDEKYQWFDYYKNKKDAATEQFRQFNLLIVDAVDDFNKKQKSMQVILFDADAAVAEIAKQFKNTTTPWYDTKYFPEKGGWFWFDHWHYMTETHKYLAEHIFQALP